MENVIKIAVIAVSATLCAVVINKQAPEVGVLLGILAGSIILFCSFPALSAVKEFMEKLAQTSGISPAVLTPVIKTTGIAIVTKLSAEICRSAKEGGVAAFLELAGAATALFVCLPLLEAVLSMVLEML